MFTDEQKAMLSAKLDSRNVATRAQQGKQLSYIEGWWAIAEANRIFGFDGWQRETVTLHMTGEPYQTPARNGGHNWRVGYLARVVVRVWNGDTWIAREGTGYGSGIGNDLNDAHESAAKEAETDAMKRALMTFGNPFGLALYDKQQANVDHGGQANHAAMNPGQDEPGGEQDVAAKVAEWCDGRAIELDAIAKSGEAGALAVWHAKHSKALLRLKASHEAQYDKLMGLYDDVYSMLGKADGGPLPITFAG
jgi:DNA recombination protein Rad52